LNAFRVRRPDFLRATSLASSSAVDMLLPLGTSGEASSLHPDGNPKRSSSPNGASLLIELN
jgi:hypothetical protein